MCELNWLVIDNELKKNCGYIFYRVCCSLACVFVLKFKCAVHAIARKLHTCVSAVVRIEYVYQILCLRVLYFFPFFILFYLEPITMGLSHSLACWLLFYGLCVLKTKPSLCDMVLMFQDSDRNEQVHVWLASRSIQTRCSHVWYDDKLSFVLVAKRKQKPAPFVCNICKWQ